MTIQIRRQVEPLSLATQYEQAVIIESDAYRQVCLDLQMYVNGEILGRSFLVAGHRGAGKTTMLRHAVQDIEARNRNQGETAAQYARPLFIPLHGPDLLDRPAGPKDTGKNESAPPHDDLRHFLDRITSGLYFGAAQEFARCFREEADRVATTDRQRSELMELAADLQVQLDRQPDLDRLRDYWNRLNALDGGVLFQPARDAGRGVREVTALFSIGRVMRTFAGTVSSSTETEAKRSRDESFSLVTVDGQSLLAPLIGLVTGSVVWQAIGGDANALVKAFSALITGLGAVLAFKISATRSRSTSQTWKETYIPKDDPGSLYRVLPGLIERFQRVGLFPVFVVDELDKVPGLSGKINSLLGYLKQFVTERAFFCFVANRSFYQQAHAQVAGAAYSTLHTRFGQSVFVRYQPVDFLNYLHDVITVDAADQAVREKEDRAATMLRYLLLSRSYLHPYDLRGALAEFDDGTGKVNEKVDDLIDKPRLQRDVAMQVAVETVYAGAALREHVRDPITAQITLDALYYPLRMWRDGSDELEITQAKLTEYLVARTGIQEEVAAGETRIADEKLVPQSLQKTLFEEVERMMGLLTEPRTLVAEARSAGLKLPDTIEKMLITLEPLVQKV